MNTAEFQRARHTLGMTKPQMAAALGLGKNGWRTILRIEQGANITGPMGLAVQKLLDDDRKRASVPMEALMSDTSIKLKPCPFCGADARWVDIHDRIGEPFGLVVDHAEHCFIGWDVLADLESIITAWNTRTPEDTTP